MSFSEYKEIKVVKGALLALFLLFAAVFITTPVSAAEASFLVTGEIAPSFSATIVPSGGAVAFPMIVGVNEKTSGIAVINIESNAPWKITALDSVQLGEAPNSNGRFKYMNSGSTAIGTHLTNPLAVKVTNGTYTPLSMNSVLTPVSIMNGNAGSYSGVMSFQQNVTSSDAATGTNYLWMTLQIVASAA